MTIAATTKIIHAVANDIGAFSAKGRWDATTKVAARFAGSMPFWGRASVWAFRMVGSLDLLLILLNEREACNGKENLGFTPR